MSNDFSAPGYGTPPPIATPTGKGSKRKNDKAPTKRSSSLLGILAAGFALVMALLLVVFLFSGKSSTFVVRSAVAMQPLVEVQGSQVEAVEVPQEAIEPGTISAPSAAEALSKAQELLAGKWLRYPIGEHRQLRADDFVNYGELSTPLQPDERMISVVAKAPNAAAAEVRPGDFVDFYNVDQNRGAGLVASNIEVISATIQPDAFDTIANEQMQSPTVTLDTSVPGTPIPGTYLIRVKASDVPRFAFTSVNGTLYVSLRPKGAVDAPPAGLIDGTNAVCSETNMYASCGDPNAVVDGLAVTPTTGEGTPIDGGNGLPADPNAGVNPDAGTDGTDTLPPTDGEASPSAAPSASTR